MDIVVADATPLIVLGRLDLLNSIAGYSRLFTLLQV